MTRYPKHSFYAATLAATLACLPQILLAQAGDKRDEPGQVQEEVWKTMDVPPAPILSPEEAMESFEIEAGYSLELVAAEPLVNDPVAVTWDEHGRLWVAEMWAFMPDVDGTGEDQPVSRVVVLEDLDNDGQMDRSTVFLDKLVLPRAVAIVEDGVLIADPPNLYFCKDTDGDLVSDEKTIVAPYAVKGNVEHAENGLLRGIDNWYYNAKSNRRFKFENGQITFEDTHFRGQWGITQDDYGRLYYTTNSFYLYGDTIPWENVSKHPGHKPTAGFRTPVVPDQSVFTNRINPGLNRAYRENWLRPDFRMKKTDAISAPAIARGHRYPEDAQGNALVPEPGGNVVSRFQLANEELEIHGTKQLHDGSKWGEIEFIASTDERFRPVATALGPDGFMYVVDMYRGILQHKAFLTTFLRKQIIERGLDNPVGLGRIYRIVHESDDSSRAAPKLADLTSAQLAEKLDSDNGWERDTAQRLLVESRSISKEATDILIRQTASANTVTRLHALWTLEGLGLISEEILTTAFETGDEFVQAHVLRISEPLLPQANAQQNELWQSYMQALSSDSKRIRLQAVHLLGRVENASVTQHAIANLPESDLTDPYFLDALVSTLHQHETSILELAESAPNSDRYKQLLSLLVQAVFKAGYTDTALHFAAVANQQQTPAPITEAITQGFLNAMEAKNVTPLEIASKPQSFVDEESPIYAAFTWEGKIDPNAVVAYQYSDEELASINRGKPLYENLCGICHQANGEGHPSLAPELVGVDWVTGDKRRLALVVGQGLYGPIEVGDTLWSAAMPAHGKHASLKGEAFNDVLNYIRSAWGNNASPFEPGEARGYLEEQKDRTEPWIAEEFEDL
ncbi:DUF7133 domain-containing protein [Pelagicoccus mobilis]|uniref:Cytochrome c domain-containing protein n=1 Tax=Pelagicoccus mobilis TaxID=415221 RepID=A0A934RUB2_9BACT|nr:c-type cytochrome [Pelagicoccus mobilis]MBK1876551.1 hypothetical protein [Pelagicoccus mobilis]